MTKSRLHMSLPFLNRSMVCPEITLWLRALVAAITVHATRIRKTCRTPALRLALFGIFFFFFFFTDRMMNQSILILIPLLPKASVERDDRDSDISEFMFNVGVMSV